MELCRLVLLTWLWIPARGEEAISVSCLVRETCVLPCRFEDKENDLQNIEWYKSRDGRLLHALVHAIEIGADVLGRQSEAYRARTSMFPEQVSGGNASVQLSTVRTEDEGLYLCRIHKISHKRSDMWVNLRVEAPVKAVTLEQRGDVLVCRSEGVYPQPNVSWTPPSELQTQEEPMEDGLYSVSSSLPLGPQAPQCCTCNVSTYTSWKSATYCLQPPVERSANVTIPCVDTTAPGKSLKWTFNYIHPIVTRSGAEVSVAAPWRPFVEAVSESGSLRLKDLGPEQEGKFVCELHTDDSNFTSRTELREADHPALSSAGIGLVTFVIMIVIIGIIGIIIFLVVRHRKKQRTGQGEQSPLLKGCKVTKALPLMLQTTLKDLSKSEMEKFKSLLADQSFMKEFRNIPRDELDKEKDISKTMIKVYGVYSVSVTERILEELKKKHLLKKLSKYDPEEILKQCMKERLSEKFKFLSERINRFIEKTGFNNSDTELFITEGGSVQVSEEKSTQYRIVHGQDLFKCHSHNEKPNRTVLTKGEAGVGKTRLTQKVCLDWAEGRVFQDVQLLLPFTFRELNVLRDRRFSLVELLQHFFSETKGLCSFQLLQLLFIFDGLDECSLPLDFSRTRVLTEPTESASVEELLVNLIRGSLLPSARLWITTRPAAANQIPAECVSMVTEVRGFSEQQKEQYFRNRFRDEATAVISHIKTSPSLYAMCDNPLFCWILSVVLHTNLEQTEKLELPKTLTEMYVRFLLVQTKVCKNILYEGRDETDSAWSPETRKMVLSLGKLAFEQLQKGNLIFSESDPSKCGLDAAEIARHSRIFREEPGLIEGKVYCFIHQTVQEFLAALHVHQTFFSSVENLLSAGYTSGNSLFYPSAVDQALQSPNGHLDLLLRFLLGLSLPTNQRLLTGLLTETRRAQTNQRLLTETVKYIKEKLNKGRLSAERSLNLLHCLHELNDSHLVKQIEKSMRKGAHCWVITPAQWSALSVLLLSSHSDPEEFELRKFCPTEEAFLLPGNKVTLSWCGLSPLSCDPLASVLGSSILKHLDLSNNDLQDLGVELLCEGLKRADCRLETLSLSWCGLSPLSCDPLASVLSSSILKHLDLSNNDLQDLGVELLCKGLKRADCRLETLRLSGCLISEGGGASLAKALSSSNLKELDLTYNHPGPSAERLTALRGSHDCTLESLRLDPSGEQFMVPGLRKYSFEFSLEPNTAHRKLLLSEDNRTVTHVREEQPYPDDMDRFTHWKQVLSSTAMTGRCYFEVDYSGRNCHERFSIAVSSKRIKRTGNSRECVFGGLNDLSWSLTIRDNRYFARHNGTETFLSCTVSPQVGVFLDFEAGDLSFYQVLSEGLSHMHTFNTSFTEPLFPGFEVGDDSKVTLVDMKS